jgi:hypothetical protein
MALPSHIGVELHYMTDTAPHFAALIGTDAEQTIKCRLHICPTYGISQLFLNTVEPHIFGIQPTDSVTHGRPLI